MDGTYGGDPFGVLEDGPPRGDPLMWTPLMGSHSVSPCRYPLAWKSWSRRLEGYPGGAPSKKTLGWTPSKWLHECSPCWVPMEGTHGNLKKKHWRGIPGGETMPGTPEGPPGVGPKVGPAGCPRTVPYVGTHRGGLRKGTLDGTAWRKLGWELPEGISWNGTLEETTCPKPPGGDPVECPLEGTTQMGTKLGYRLDGTYRRDPL
jgi:hypothetical protein